MHFGLRRIPLTSSDASPKVYLPLASTRDYQVYPRMLLIGLIRLYITTMMQFENSEKEEEIETQSPM